MGKTRDLFKKIRDTKETFHAKMGSIKERNNMDITEAEDITKRWQVKRLFSSSSLSAIRVVSSAYLRSLIFLPAILIPACVSSSPAFLMMYSA